MGFNSEFKGLKELFMSNKITDILDCATKCNYVVKSKKLLS